MVQPSSYSEFPERSRDISWIHVTITQQHSSKRATSVDISERGLTRLRVDATANMIVYSRRGRAGVPMMTTN